MPWQIFVKIFVDNSILLELFFEDRSNGFFLKTKDRSFSRSLKFVTETWKKPSYPTIENVTTVASYQNSVLSYQQVG